MKTCKLGHALTADNVYMSYGKYANCKICMEIGRHRRSGDKARADEVAAEYVPKKSKGSGVVAPRTYLSQMARDAMK